MRLLDRLIRRTIILSTIIVSAIIIALQSFLSLVQQFNFWVNMDIIYRIFYCSCQCKYPRNIINYFQWQVF